MCCVLCLGFVERHGDEMVLSQFNDEKKLMSFHQNLEDVTEDQLSLASIHYMRSHYPEAIDIYKRLLLQNRWAGRASAPPARRLRSRSSPSAVLAAGISWP